MVLEAMGSAPSVVTAMLAGAAGVPNERGTGRVTGPGGNAEDICGPWGKRFEEGPKL